jgi:SAM-dependent methyltransferase
VLVRLLFCREAEPANLVCRSLGAGLADGMLSCGLLTGVDRLIFPFHLRIVQGLFVLSDFLVGHSDAVMGAGETTSILYRAGQPMTRVRCALDLGCGAGTLALLLAADSDFVVGADVNARAIDIARFNAALNSIRNVNFREGDMYEPVAGERFDLILSQPPYYPNSADEPGQMFLHGGEFGDELSNRVIAGLPEHLSDTGQAVLFTSWPEGRQAQCPDGFHVLELNSSRLEINGTRQSLNVFRRGVPTWLSQLAIPPDSWGYIRPMRIDRMFAAELLLRDPDALLRATLRIPPGTRVLEEGDQIVLQGTPESLISTTPVDDVMWQTLTVVNASSTVGDAKLDGHAWQRLDEAIRRGLLVPSGRE